MFAQIGNEVIDLSVAYCLVWGSHLCITSWTKFLYSNTIIHFVGVIQVIEGESGIISAAGILAICCAIEEGIQHLVKKCFAWKVAMCIVCKFLE